jgi:hypothetical protein
MGESGKPLDLPEIGYLEVDPCHPCHKMNVPETTESFFDIRLCKISLIAVFFRSLSLVYEKSAEKGAFFPIHLGPESLLEKTEKWSGTHEQTHVHQGSEGAKITHARPDALLEGLHSVSDLEFGIPERIEDAADDFVHLRGELGLMNHQEIHVRAKTELAPAIAPEGDDGYALVEDLCGSFTVPGLQEECMEEPIHECGIALSHQET